MPVRIFEGVRDDERADLSRRNLERRFYALAAAVRDHELAGSRNGDGPASERDDRLYRRLRQLSGEPLTSEHSVA